VQTGQDDDHLHPPKLLDHAEALIEYGAADDLFPVRAVYRNDDPHDAAKRDLAAYLLRHGHLFQRGDIDLIAHDGSHLRACFGAGVELD
jgi:hypothetical protein